MTDAEKRKEAEQFVRRALSHSDSKVDEASIKKAAEKIASALPPYRSVEETKS